MDDQSAQSCRNMAESSCGATRPQFVILFLAVLTLTVSALHGDSGFAAEKKPLPTAHTSRKIEGWIVRVDDRLLMGEHAADGARALK